jgi:hypothetical protein
MVPLPVGGGIAQGSSMRGSSELRRAVASAVLVMSTASAALLPLADAYAEIAAATPHSHVEAPGTSGCPPAHDEIACQLCRVLRLVGSGSTGSDDLLSVDGALALPPTRRIARPVTRLEPSSSPRAPPVA